MGNIFSSHSTSKQNNKQNSHTLTKQQYEQYKYFMQQQQQQKQKIKKQEKQLEIQNKKLDKIKNHITNHLTTNNNQNKQAIHNPYQLNTEITPNNNEYFQKQQFDTYRRFNQNEVDNTTQYWNQTQKNKHKIYNQYQTQNQNEPQWKTDKSQYSKKTIKTEEDYKQEFIRKQNKRRKKYEKKLSMFDNHEVFDAYQILNVSENYNLSELKLAYKQAALQTHPDKGGNPKLFKLVTKAYMYLLDKFKNKESKQYSNLKQDFQQFTENQIGNSNNNNIDSNGAIRKSRTMAKFKDNEGFNNQLFNKIYTDHRLYSINDEGYTKWMKDKKNRVKRQNPIKNSKMFSILCY